MYVKDHLTKTNHKLISGIELNGVSKKHGAKYINHSQIIPHRALKAKFDAKKTCALLELLIKQHSLIIQHRWAQLCQLMQLEPLTIQSILKESYFESARQYYSQTIVEVYSNINAEDLTGIEIDNENVTLRQSIKESGRSMNLHK